MKIKGFGIGLAGSIVSIVFSILGLIGSLVFDSISHSQSFIDAYTRNFMSGSEGYSYIDAYNSLDITRTIAAILVYAYIIYLILGILALIFVLIAKPRNSRTMGIFVLIISILHILTFRVVAFGLLLASSIQMINNKPVLNGDQ